MFSISRFASANSLRRLRNSVSFCLNFALSASDGWLLTRPLAIFSVYGSSIIFCCIFLVRFETYVAADRRRLVFRFFFTWLFLRKGFGVPQGSNWSRVTPATAIWAAASRISKSELSPGLPGFTAIVTTSGFPSRICPTNLVRVFRGPNSTNTLAPSLYIFSTCLTNCTELVIWVANKFTARELSPGYGLPVTLLYTVTPAVGLRSPTERTLVENVVSASFMNGVWKASPTFS